MSRKFLLLIACVLLWGCVSESLEPQTAGEPVEYHAVLPSTKTVMDESVMKSRWYGQETISLIGRSSYVFTSSLAEPSAEAVFSYRGEKFEEQQVIAVYPSGKYSADLLSQAVSGVTVPHEQIAVAGSYDPNASVMVAYTEDRTLHFKNVVSLLKFEIGCSGIYNVTVWGPGVNPAGKGTLKYNEGQPVVEGADKSYIELRTADGSEFKQGVSYYIALLPSTFAEGMTVELNKEPVLSTTNALEVERNNVYDLGVLMFPKYGAYSVPETPSADSPCTIFYQADENSPFYGYKGELYAHIGVVDGEWKHTVAQWGVNTDKCRLTKVKTNLWSLELDPTIRQWFNSGSTPLGRIGIVVRNENGTKQTDDMFILVNDQLNGESSALPSGMKHGINTHSNGAVTLVLYEKDNQGWHYDTCHVLGDFNGWNKTDTFSMKRDETAGCWWITITGLVPEQEYRFQYELTTGTNSIRIFDPYTEIVYDGWNDHYISSDTYPDMPAYPSGAWDQISAFQIDRQDDYSWQVKDYRIEDKDDFVIYELLLRDFSTTHDLKGALNQLDYLDGLGIDAIELMPVQEFDGNLSWGYNPCAYFALDKAYGTRWDYKHFIDECHKRGIAVLLDVTYNHATGAHPYAKMYWDSTNNKTSWTNPFFNTDAPHQWSVYHDWNHDNPLVRDHIKRSLAYLLTEYKVDGFRFDLTKGFTQNSGTEGSYDQSRVDKLKEYYYHILSVNPDAVMICEHFCDEENWELGGKGMKVWRNMNHSYRQAAMGHSDNSDFSGMREHDGIRFGTFVGYMESHDEERMMYSAKEYGTDRVKADYKLRLKRAQLNAAFSLLVPGPKMIWQFGEIGYDYSVGYGGDNTSEKPVVTEEYMKDANRKALYDMYAALLRFRHENPRFFDNDAEFRWYVDGAHWPGRYMFCRNANGQNFALFGNFGYGNNDISVQLPHGGKWYNWFDHREETTWNGQNHTPNMGEGDFYLLVDF